MELVIATKNMHKLREFREILQGIEGLDVLSLCQFSHYEPPPEDADTFQKNAEKKALHAVQELQKWVLADDSGLVVPSLKGAPGVLSRRFAGEDATDSENRAKLLGMLDGKEDLDRSAYFECWLSLASPEGLVKSVVGYCEGYIAVEEKGRSGFGYDSIFIKHDYDKTFGELEERVKNRVSHRRKAIDKIQLYLENKMSS